MVAEVEVLPSQHRLGALHCRIILLPIPMNDTERGTRDNLPIGNLVQLGNSCAMLTIRPTDSSAPPQSPT
jgi:hypothetical protein